MDTCEEVIDKCPDGTSTDMMYDYVNKNLDNTNKNDWNEVNEIGVDDKEEEKTKEIEN